MAKTIEELEAELIATQAALGATVRALSAGLNCPGSAKYIEGAAAQLDALPEGKRAAELLRKWQTGDIYFGKA